MSRTIEAIMAHMLAVAKHVAAVARNSKRPRKLRLVFARLPLDARQRGGNLSSASA